MCVRVCVCVCVYGYTYNLDVPCCINEKAVLMKKQAKGKGIRADNATPCTVMEGVWAIASEAGPVLSHTYCDEIGDWQGAHFLNGLMEYGL